MDALESIRSYTEQDLEENSDMKGYRVEEEEDREIVDKRKRGLSNSRKRNIPEENEEWEDGRKRKSVGDKNDIRKKLGGSSRGGSGDEESCSKIMKKTHEGKSVKILSSVYQDRESEISRKGRDVVRSEVYCLADENERNRAQRRPLKRLLRAKLEARRIIHMMGHLKMRGIGIRGIQERWKVVEIKVLEVMNGKGIRGEDGMNLNLEVRRTKRSRSPERIERHRQELDEIDRGFSQSDNERSIIHKGRQSEKEAYGNDRSKGRDRDWGGSKDSWRKRQQSRNDKEAKDGDCDFDYKKEWDSQRRERDRMDNEKLHGRPAYRKDRTRTEGMKTSSVGTKNEYSDVIEIRPKSLDYEREESGSMFSRHTSAGQTSSRGSLPPFGNNQGPGSFNKGILQGRKGGRRGRGGGVQGRDGQHVIPVPMVGPPFGHLSLPPGPMRPIGPNMSAAPGPPIIPIFIPPSPGPIVWPGPRGFDMNALAAPPELSPIPPPRLLGPRFLPNMGTGPNHAMYFNQFGPGRGVSPITDPGFNIMGPIGRGVPHDNAPMGWGPPRISAPPGKAPSRGEQNDYSQNFVDTGMRTQNFIRGLELTSVVEDYPKLRELIQRKDEIVAKSSSPPMYYKCDLREHVLSPEFFGTKFDVILVDPPWEEYFHRAPGVTDHMEYWTPKEIQNLKIEAFADTPSFIFLRVGDGVGLEQGRLCLKKLREDPRENI
ncbi:N6-adenosine-methyltransferase non-catalytic subunit MTB-like [Tasmannia lanceolata]|uniref:N6-adenosine-methyltransferase non-catalytic subunit MTB-like n=1 Tax=Tasmannia lanceolata TaxID=3420 RepID=UPI004062A355